MGKIKYTTHDNIDSLTEDYIKTVSGVKEIREIQLTDINEFLEGLENFSRLEKE